MTRARPQVRPVAADPSAALGIRQRASRQRALPHERRGGEPASLVWLLHRRQPPFLTPPPVVAFVCAAAVVHMLQKISGLIHALAGRRRRTGRHAGHEAAQESLHPGLRAPKFTGCILVFGHGVMLLRRNFGNRLSSMFPVSSCTSAADVFLDRQVRCVKDHGELEIDDGTLVLLKKNSQVRAQLFFFFPPPPVKAVAGSESHMTRVSTALPATLEMRALDSSRHPGACRPLSDHLHASSGTKGGVGEQSAAAVCHPVQDVGLRCFFFFYVSSGHPPKCEIKKASCVCNG